MLLKRRNRLRTKWYSLLHRDSHSRRPALVCEEWRVYERFAADVGEPPSGDSVLCMRDPDLGFRPGNAYWGSKQERLAHRRHLRTVTIGTETLNLTQWAERLGIHRITLAERVCRHGEAVAVTVPKLPRGGSHIKKTRRRRRPRVHIGVFEREGSVTPDMETEGFLQMLLQCDGETDRMVSCIREMYGDEAAERAVAVLHDE